MQSESKIIPYLNMSLGQKLQQLKKNNFDFLIGLHARAGDISQIKIGFQTIVFINHPEYAKHILHTNMSNYPKDPLYQLVEQIIGPNILTTNEMEFWGKRRKVLAELFQPKSVSGMAKDIIGVINEFIEIINQKKTICINELTTSLTLKIITRLLFSTAIRENEITQLSDILSYFCELLIKKNTPLALSLPIRFNRRFHKAHKALIELIKTIIKTERSGVKPDLVTLLSRHQCPHTGAHLSEEELVSEATLMFFAGHETTANALTWLFITLSKYPEIRRNLQQEIKTVLNGKTLEISDLENMPLVQGLVMEVLRLFPSFPAVPRHSLHNDVIDGYQIPANAMIIVNIAMIHRHPEFWLNPEGFDPYRFNNNKLKHKYAYLPFIHGPRVCIGSHLALLELQLITVLFLQQFDFNLIAGQEIASDFVFSLRTKDDVYMKVDKPEM